MLHKHGIPKRKQTQKFALTLKFKKESSLAIKFKKETPPIALTFPITRQRSWEKKTFYAESESVKSTLSFRTCLPEFVS